MPRIFKFGGALIKDGEGIRQVTSIIRPYVQEPLIVVVSAMGKTTNALEEILQLAFNKKETELHQAISRLKKQHEQVIDGLFKNDTSCKDKLSLLFEALKKELNSPGVDKYEAYDRIVGFGERMSSMILHDFFLSEGLSCERVEAGKIIATDSNFTSANVDWKKTEELVRKHTATIFNHGSFMLTEGFTGADISGHPTTLGREGSDFTAAILAYVLDAKEVTIWKDVPGLMNADPNRFDDSIKLDGISYREAIELAFYGASVIHPKTIQPLQKKNIPLFVRPFRSPENKPSVISYDGSMDDKTPKIIVKDNQVLLSIQSKNLDFIAEDHLTTIFETFSRHKIHINLMQHSAVSFSVCFDYRQSKMEGLLRDLKTEFPFKYNTGLQLLTIRHYTEDIIKKLLKDRQIFLEQKSRTTYQVLVK